MRAEDIDLILESKNRRYAVNSKIYGVGVNDVSHSVGGEIKGRMRTHSAYSTWKSIIARCYSKEARKKCQTYGGCSVSHEWLYFSNFKSWWTENSVYGWEIDKDLLHVGNKTYSHEHCTYITKWINAFTTGCESRRGEFPIGACFDRKQSSFMARISVDGRSLTIGRFANPLSAHKAWYKKKIELAHGYKELCDSIHPELFAGLLRKIEAMKVEML